jgi:hypothetical protein
MGQEDALEVVARVPAPTDRTDQHIAGIEQDTLKTSVIHHDQSLPKPTRRFDHIILSSMLCCPRPANPERKANASLPATAVGPGAAGGPRYEGEK